MTFQQWLERNRDNLRRTWYSLDSNNIRGIGDSIHGLLFEADEDGDEYVTIGFNLPKGVYAEIEDGTYGELQGFRIYRKEK